MKKIQISIPRLFKPPVMTEGGLAELAARAWELSRTSYSEESVLPANIHALARRLAVQARHCAGLLASPTSAEDMMRAGYELGSHLQDINRMMATWAALQQKRVEYERRSAGADAIHGENRGAREEAVAYYMQHRERLSGNLSAAAREIAGRVPFKHSTIRRWLAEHEKLLRQ